MRLVVVYTSLVVQPQCVSEMLNEALPYANICIHTAVPSMCKNAHVSSSYYFSTISDAQVPGVAPCEYTTSS